jgi:hypothetical protein
MSTRQFPLSVALAVTAAVAITGASRAETPPQQAPCVVPAESHAESMAGRAPCFLEDETRVVSVRPYHGKATLERAALVLQGAELELLPAPGLTADDLQARLQRVLRARQREPLPVCMVGVGHVHIGSNPMGEASSVTLIARDPKDAEQVFHRAQLLVK